jgi:hypothetical protein
MTSNGIHSRFSAGRVSFVNATTRGKTMKNKTLKAAILSTLGVSLAATAPVALAAEDEGIDFGGAVRFQYSYEDYDEGNENRGGDIDLDTFRLNVDGTVGDVILSGEWRYYQYMEVIHHAWVGYDFNENWQGQAGITKVPFGNMPYNSHSFFFSSNYYLGLEDDYDAGLKALFEKGPWDVQFAFFKNDELGGVDGYVSDRSDRYSYDVVAERDPADGTFDDPSDPGHAGSEVGETNTFVARVAHTLTHSDTASTEIGFSTLYGALHDDVDDVGDYNAAAIHLNGTYGPWNIQLQATQYEYDMDSGAERMAVGAYAFYDTIAAEATTYTANVAYSMPVSWGPVTNLTFYNDYSLVTDKSADLADTTMNVTGMAVSAGGVYAYFDYIVAENQPFIGGTMDSTGSESANRFNINVGYYF